MENVISDERNLALHKPRIRTIFTLYSQTSKCDFSLAPTSYLALRRRRDLTSAKQHQDTCSAPPRDSVNDGKYDSNFLLKLINNS